MKDQLKTYVSQEIARLKQNIDSVMATRSTMDGPMQSKSSHDRQDLELEGGVKNGILTQFELLYEDLQTEVKDRVEVGCVVTIGFENGETVILVISRGVVYLPNIEVVSVNSPLSLAMAGKKIGERVSFKPADAKPIVLTIKTVE